MIQVSALYIYPIKACAGIELQGVRLDDRGPQFDRRWMLVDEHGQMITQREHPRCVLAKPSLLPTQLLVHGPGLNPIKIPLSAAGPRRPAIVWGHETEAFDQGDPAAAWFTQLLDHPVRLVRWAEDQIRPVSKRHTDLDSQTAFADGYPLLLISAASLRDLNQRIGSAMPALRFRPNIVVDGCEPYEEDHFRDLRIGNLEVTLVKACSRCAVINVDPSTAAVDPEPLKTLASFRNQGSKLVFGQNGIHHGWGMIRKGDPVQVCSRTSSAS